MFKQSYFDLDFGDINRKFSDFFTLTKILHSGKNAIYVIAKQKQTERQLLVKIVKKQADKVKFIQREVKILAKLEHHNIIEQTAQIETDTKYLIVTEFAAGGNLQNLLKEGRDFKELDCVLIMKGILSAVNYFHEKNISINELSSKNIVFLNKDDYTSLKLVNFPMAEYYDSNSLKVLEKNTYRSTSIKFEGEKVYRLRFNKFKSNDIYKCAKIMFKLHSSPSEQRKNSDNVDFNKLPSKFNEQSSDLFYKLISKAEKRITAKVALSHIWFSERTDSEIELNKVNLDESNRLNDQIHINLSDKKYNSISAQALKKAIMPYKFTIAKLTKKKIQPFKKTNNTTATTTNTEFQIYIQSHSKNNSMTLNESKIETTRKFDMRALDSLSTQLNTERAMSRGRANGMHSKRVSLPNISIKSINTSEQTDPQLAIDIVSKVPNVRAKSPSLNMKNSKVDIEKPDDLENLLRGYDVFKTQFNSMKSNREQESLTQRSSVPNLNVFGISNHKDLYRKQSSKRSVSPAINLTTRNPNATQFFRLFGSFNQ